MSDGAQPGYLIAGLGNPGAPFRDNRHNVGFQIVDRLAMEIGLRFTQVRFQALVTVGVWHDRKLYLVKPQTYMNRVGRSIGPLSRTHEIPLENLLICYDDLDLPLGTIRIKPKGGSAGHKGMRSVIASLGSSEFPRLRVGIDRPPGKKDPADYVLEDFSPLEKETVKETASQAVDCIRMYLFEGLEPAMNHCNQQRS